MAWPLISTFLWHKLKKFCKIYRHRLTSSYGSVKDEGIYSDPGNSRTKIHGNITSPREFLVENDLKTKLRGGNNSSTSVHWNSSTTTSTTERQKANDS